MPTDDGVRVHDNQGGAPILPRVREQHPKQSISLAELRTPHGALEHGQLLTERQILERDRSVSTADQPERSKRDDERSQHDVSCPAITHRINRGDLILANDTRPENRSNPVPQTCSAHRNGQCVRHWRAGSDRDFEGHPDRGQRGASQEERDAQGQQQC